MESIIFDELKKLFGIVGAIIGIIIIYHWRDLWNLWKRTKNVLYDRFYWDFKRLQCKQQLDKFKLKIFWVDDIWKDDEIAKIDHQDNRQYSDLKSIKEGLSNLAANIKTSSCIQSDDEELNSYHMLIFDIGGVYQNGNQYMALSILANQYAKNPFRIFIILTGQQSISDDLIKPFGFHRYNKGSNIINSLKADVKNYLDPKWLWKHKIEPVLNEYQIGKKKINKIKCLFIKDWYTITHASIANPIEKESLLLWQLAKQERENDKELSDHLCNICNFIIL